MTRTILSAALLFFTLFSSLLAQEATPKSELHFCGVTERSAWLDAYQRGEIAAVRSMDTLLLPLRIHIVGNNQGGGYVAMSSMLGSIKLLNEDFASANVAFYIDGDIDYINNSGYYNHSFATGANMMAFNNDPDVINVYFVGNPAGACGYYSPTRDALAIGNNCTGPGDKTLSHEVGHYLSLPHTFDGWEGFYSSPQAMPSEAPTDEPAPLTVGGRFVEKADSSNCATAGDGFCDTPADYLSERWGCVSGGIYGDSLMDPDSTMFVVYGFPIMSYALDACQDNFSDEQITAMTTNINTQRSGMISDLPIESNMADVTTMELLSPPSGSNLQPVDGFAVDLEWSAADNADFYIVQLATNAVFANIFAEIVVEDTTLTLTEQPYDLEIGTRYHWRVRPVNRFNVMSGTTSGRNFRVTEILSGSIDPTLDAAISIFPNPVQAGKHLVNISARGLSSDGNLQLDLVSTNGAVVLKAEGLNVINGQFDYDLNVADLVSGVYYLRIRQADRLLTRKLVIGR